MQVCWEGGGTPLERGVLRLASLFYGLGLGARRYIYRMGLRESVRLSAPVLSVGNITLGGTGKTPMVAWLAETLVRRGLRVAVVSRGYGRKEESKVLVVSRGDGALVSSQEGGDEPVMLAEALPGVSVVVAARRAEGARLAIQELGAEIVILDDGFQHWALARDLDVVLVDGEGGFGNGLLFPAGPLREPLEALKRAHILVITKKENPSLHERLVELAPQAPIFTASLEVRGLWSSTEDALLPLETLEGAEVAAFAALARPNSFFALLQERLGARVVEKRAFPDHYIYGEGDLETFRSMAQMADWVVTTEKDWVRLKDKELGFALLVLKVALRPPLELVELVFERLGLRV